MGHDLPKIRTFADDVAKSRSVSGVSVVPPTPSVETVTPIAPKEPISALPKVVSVPVPKKKNKPVRQQTPVSNDDLEIGSIVRETKRHKMRLFPAIGQALTAWAKDTKHKVETVTEKAERKESVTLVTNPTARAQTVATAATMGVLPHSDDHKKITITLKQKPKVAATTGITLEGKSAEPKAAWSSSTITKPELETAPPTPKDPVPLPNETVAEPVHTKPTPEPVPESVTIEEPPAPQHVEEPESKPEPKATPVPLPKKKSQRKSAQYPFKHKEQHRVPITTRLLPFGVGIAILLATTAGAGGTYYLFKLFVTKTPVTIAPATSVIAADELVSYTLDANDVFSTVTDTTAGATNTLVIYTPHTVLDGQVVPANGSDVVARLPFSWNGPFSRSITEFSFGTFENKRFIVLETNSFDTAFSGMLAWESTMAKDLSPWFGDASTASFTDTTSDNHDIRVAKYSDGGELYYTFLDRTTILIATDRTVLPEVAGKRK